MSLTEVQKQAASLNPDERRKLAAFLTALRMKETGEWEETISASEQAHHGWVTLDEAKRRLLGGS
jgi:hypothetical protein